MKEIRVSKINESIENRLTDFLYESDLRYNEQIEIIAERVAANREKRPIVLLAGPRGSGKKISARKIRKELEKLGVRAFLISLDNYHLSEEESGVWEYEHPIRIDRKAFTEDMLKIVEGKPIYVTSYDKQSEGYTVGGEIDFRKGDVLIVEGLQALNPDVTDDCDNYASLVYASVRTRIVGNSGQRLHPSKIRLLRRLVRDGLYHGEEISEILDACEETQRREDRFVMPYKYRANYEIDTFIGYELSVYKPLILKKLSELESTYPLSEKIGDLMRLLREIEEIDISKLPEKSMIHDFMDGVKL